MGRGLYLLEHTTLFTLVTDFLDQSFGGCIPENSVKQMKTEGAAYTKKYLNYLENKNSMEDTIKM